MYFVLSHQGVFVAAVLGTVLLSQAVYIRISAKHPIVLYAGTPLYTSSGRS